jgi:carbohydrate kinase (thermoresistant glucokinase family)
VIVVVMGVSGSGKSTVGALLAARLGLPFVEADDLHDPAAIARMAAGEPLTETDRAPWLARVHDRLAGSGPTGAVCACSALTRASRERLAAGLPDVRFVWLDGPPALIAARLADRTANPVGPALLPSQISTLEPPADALHLDVTEAPDRLVDRAAAWLAAPG